MAEKTKAIHVSDLPEGVTENNLTIHFQKKKNGGGEVEKVKLLPGGQTAEVVFEDPAVVQEVMKKQQIIKGKVVKIKLSPESGNQAHKMEKGTRAIHVSDLPEYVTENTLIIHFQKKKNGGGEVQKVTLLPGAEAAEVIFEDPEVVQEVIKKQQIIKGKVVKIDLAKKSGNQVDEMGNETRTIHVSDLPEGVDESTLTIYFQKKKFGGGEVEKVTLLPGAQAAAVVFEDAEVAREVMKREHTIKGKTIKIGLPRENENQGGRMETKLRSIYVSGLPEGITENTLTIYFQKNKNGGGEVEEVTLLPGGQAALVVFENPQVPHEVVKRNHSIKGKNVKVSLQKMESDNQESLSNKTRTVLVSNLPKGIRKNDVQDYFQREKHGGGDIVDVKLSMDGKKALVDFKDPEVAHTVVHRPHSIHGTVVEVKLFDIESKDMQPKPQHLAPENPDETEHHAAFEKKLMHNEEREPEYRQNVDVSEDPRETLMNTRETGRKVVIKEEKLPVKARVKVEESNEMVVGSDLDPTERTILVSDIPDGVGETDVVIYFGKKSNGGGEVEKAKMFPEERKALVVFAEAQVAEQVMEKEHTLKGSHVNVKKYEPTQKKNEVYDVFSTVTATINPLLLQNIERHDCKRILDETQEATGVQWHHAAYGILITGSMFQVQEARDFLRTKFDVSYKEQEENGGFRPQNQNVTKWKTDNFQSKHGVYRDDRSSQKTFPVDTDGEKFHLFDGRRASDSKQNFDHRDMASLREQHVGGGETWDSVEHRTINFPLNTSATDVYTWKEPTGDSHTWNEFSTQSYSQQPMERTTTWGGPTGETQTQKSFSAQGYTQQVMERKAAPFTENVRPRNHERDQIGSQNIHETENQGTLESKSAGSIVNSPDVKPYSQTQSRETSGEQPKKPSPPPRSGRGQKTERSKITRSDDSETAALPNTGNSERRKNAANFGSPLSTTDRFSGNLTDPEQKEAERLISDVPAFDGGNNMDTFAAESQRMMLDKKDGQGFKEAPPQSRDVKLGFEKSEKENLDEQDFHEEQSTGDPNNQDQANQGETRTPSNHSQDPSKGRLSEDKSHDPYLDSIENAFEQLSLSEEPTSLSVAQFIHQVYHKDLEMFKSQNRVDVVLTEDKKRLTLKPMQGFEPSRMDEMERKLQQFYETTSRNLKTARMDLREFSPEDAEKIKKSMTRQRGQCDVMIEEPYPDVFTLIGNAQNLELFQRNVKGAIGSEVPVPVPEIKEAMPNGPIAASRRGVRLVLMQGEIEKQECEAIVNFTDKDLVHKTGLPNIIKSAAGAEFWKECREIIAKNGSLVANMVTTTTAGSLPCRLVVHAILQDFSKERRQEVLRHSLTQTCRLALIKAKDQKLKSICFPVITPDIANLPPAVSSRLQCDVIKEFVDTNSPLNDNSIEEIRIVYRKKSKYVEESVKEFTAKF